MSEPSCWQVHDAACARGDHTYTDPDTGFLVFTRLGLLERDSCCGAGCRHCPFGHEKVRLAIRAKRIQQPAWLSEARPDAEKACTVLFWSGGKDSFLAWRAMVREGATNIVLITTFDARSRMIAHQEFAIDTVVDQAERLGLPLIGVPLHSGPDYVDQIAVGLALVPNADTLAFGDLHLETIRSWREEAFAGHDSTRGLKLAFPLWEADYAALMDDLEASGAACVISAITADLPGIAVGDRFDRSLLARLPKTVDPFGENGEFHTRIAPA
ncbi:MAG: DUF5522 domain-containing protein [Pseudomonadota bacterium]